VEQRESPAYGGQVFGKAGQYETLSGHFYGELDPKDPHNGIITDIALAPRNARGIVEYSATFSIAKPVDMSKSSGARRQRVQCSEARKGPAHRQGMPSRFSSPDVTRLRIEPPRASPRAYVETCLNQFQTFGEINPLQTT
jgi:hypothetical protein